MIVKVTERKGKHNNNYLNIDINIVYKIII